MTPDFLPGLHWESGQRRPRPRRPGETLTHQGPPSAPVGPDARSSKPRVTNCHPQAMSSLKPALQMIPNWPTAAPVTYISSVRRLLSYSSEDHVASKLKKLRAGPAPNKQLWKRGPPVSLARTSQQNTATEEKCTQPGGKATREP